MLIKKPVITEKTINQYSKNRKVTFEIDLNATKDSARKMIENIYSVTVENVKVINRLGKYKRNRITRRMSKSPDRKIAVFTLKDGDKIDLFEK